MKNFLEKIFLRLPGLMLMLGIVLRLKLWFENRSLWLDEAYLGIHVMSKSWVEILLNEQIWSDLPVPPMGFMLMEKINVTLFGNNEMALRLFPLLCGIAAIFLFYALAKRLLSFRLMVLALALFVFNDWLINYSCELKQYSSDVMVLLGLTWFFIVKTDESLGINKKDIPIFCIVGLAAVTFSHPSIFVLAAFGIYQQIRLLLTKRVEDAIVGVKVGIVWLIGFGFWYQAMVFNMLQSTELQLGAKNAGYMIGSHLWSPDALRWVLEKIKDVIQNVAGMKPALLAVLFFTAGFFGLKRKNEKALWLLFLPMMLAFSAGMVGKYLLGGRFSLFMVPAVLLVTLSGLDFISERTGKKGNFVFGICAILLLLSAAPLTWTHFYHGRPKEEAREAVRYLQANFRDGDFLMVNNQGSLALYYYLSQNGRFKVPEIMLISDGVIKRDEKELIIAALQKIDCDENEYLWIPQEKAENNVVFYETDMVGAKERIWFFGAHVKGSEDFILEYFFRRGVFPTVHITRPGAVLLLFERKNEKNSVL